MQKDNFDQLSKDKMGKWSLASKGTIPMWLADQDFLLPCFLRKKVTNYIEHMTGSYPVGVNTEVIKAIAKYSSAAMTIDINKQDILLARGVNNSCQEIIRNLTAPGDEILILSPEFHPFANHATYLGRAPTYITLKKSQQKNSLHFEFDFELFERKITHKTKMFIFSSPHNPTGSVFTIDDMKHMIDICLKHNILLVVSEIWSDLILQNTPFKSMGAMGEKVWDILILMQSVAKTFNTSTFMSAYLIVKNNELNRIISASLSSNHMLRISELGCMTTQWCLEEGQAYQHDLVQYLQKNRHYLLNFLTQHLPYIRCSEINATFIAWLDFSALNLANPQSFLLENAHVQLSPGNIYGPGNDQFVRLLFGCPRSLLEKALIRIKKACDSIYR